MAGATQAWQFNSKSITNFAADNIIQPEGERIQLATTEHKAVAILLETGAGAQVHLRIFKPPHAKSMLTWSHLLVHMYYRTEILPHPSYTNSCHAQNTLCVNSG